MKYIDKQRKKQALCRRAMNREKKEVRLLRERFLLKNFTSDERLRNMYVLMMENNLDVDNLDATQKKMYKTCQKYQMYNDYQSLKELEIDLYHFKANLDKETDNRKFWELRNQYRDLSREYNDFKKSLVNSEENRKLFYLCVGIDNLEKTLH